MKKTYAFLATLLLASGVAAQNPTAYFMEGTTFRSQFNPAFAPLRGYVNIPGLGGIDINASGNLAVDKLLYPRNGKLVPLLDEAVSTRQALSGLNADNLLGIDTRVNLIGFGAFTRNHKNFWSFDLNARTTADATLPYSLFAFLKEGTGSDIHNIGLTADSYLEAAFSYSFPLLDDRLYIGVRGKFLVGAARARMYFTRFNVTYGEEEWRIDAAGGLDITAAGLDVTTKRNDAGEEVFLRSQVKFAFFLARTPVISAEHVVAPRLDNQADLPAHNIQAFAGIRLDEQRVCLFSGLRLADGGGQRLFRPCRADERPNQRQYQQAADSMFLQAAHPFPAD